MQQYAFSIIAIRRLRGRGPDLKQHTGFVRAETMQAAALEVLRQAYLSFPPLEGWTHRIRVEPIADLEQ